MTAPIRARLRLAAGAAVSCLALLGTSACSDSPEEEPVSADTVEDEDQTPIQITIEGDTISPMGERVEVEAGEPIPDVVTADSEGSLHVHSTPEQEIDYSEGTTEHELVIDQPGVVEVESHDPDLVVLQLEVR